MLIWAIWSYLRRGPQGKGLAVSHGIPTRNASQPWSLPVTSTAASQLASLPPLNRAATSKPRRRLPTMAKQPARYYMEQWQNGPPPVMAKRYARYHVEQYHLWAGGDHTTAGHTKSSWKGAKWMRKNIYCQSNPCIQTPLWLELVED